MAGFNFEIPEELHKNFKAHCALLNVDMRDRIIFLMEKDVKKSMPNWMKPKVNKVMENG